MASSFVKPDFIKPLWLSALVGFLTMCFFGPLVRKAFIVSGALGGSGPVFLVILGRLSFSSSSSSS
ncbi:hypothetical protein HanRHA438_Chr00c45g0857911 [Helianthus annuus]|nr:hypothetical protein HanIR_Chr12g0600471 [Helianthus annuus]KAJ0953811.1 hypothetical protein HanRHA438_Chr00c45g0857911 [Helianthus annuus]